MLFGYYRESSIKVTETKNVTLYSAKITRDCGPSLALEVSRKEEANLKSRTTVYLVILMKG